MRVYSCVHVRMRMCVRMVKEQNATTLFTRWHVSCCKAYTIAGTCERTRASIEPERQRRKENDFKHKTNIRFETRDRSTNTWKKQQQQQKHDDDDDGNEERRKKKNMASIFGRSDRLKSPMCCFYHLWTQITRFSVINICRVWQETRASRSSKLSSLESVARVKGTHAHRMRVKKIGKRATT